MQTTLAIIKPDAVAKAHVGHIISRIEGQPFLSIIYIRRGTLRRDVLSELYKDHQDKGFFSSLIDFMSSGPSYVMVLQGPDAVATWRIMVGATDSRKAASDTLRWLYGAHTGPIMYNAVHASDSVESAKREIRLLASAPASYVR